MKIKSNITINESGFVFDAKTGESFSLNPTAKEIMQLLNLGRTESEIKDYFLTKYDVEDSLFTRHLDDFSQMLRHFNLIDIE